MSFYQLRASVVLCLAVCYAQAQAPAFTSVRTAAGQRESFGHAIAVDSFGSSYVAGSFGLAELGGTLDLGTTNLVSAGETDGFLAKFDPQGQCLWARQIAGVNADDAYAVALRADGNVVVAGEFLGTNRIGNTTLVSVGGLDVFVAAFTPAGDLLWAGRWGSAQDDFAIALAPSPDGSVFFSGSFNGDVNEDAVLLKISSFGTLLWTRTAGGPGFQFGSDLKVDSLGDVFWAGEFDTNIIFDTTTLTSPGINVFIAKYNSAGVLQFALKLGDGEEARLPRLALLPDDSRLLCSAVYFGQYAVSGQSLPEGFDDVLVASFDDVGLEWVTTFGGDELDVCTEVMFGPEGDCYLAGYFRGSITVGNTNLASAGSEDIFVAHCSRNGQLQTGVRAGGIGPDQALAATFAPAGRVRLTGSFSSTAEFGNISVTSSDGVAKMFLATVAPSPSLRITQQPDHVLLRWSTNFPGFTLQSAPDLVAPSWSAVTTPPVIVQGEYVVTNGVANSSQFFRLRSN